MEGIFNILFKWIYSFITPDSKYKIMYLILARILDARLWNSYEIIFTLLCNVLKSYVII